MLVDIYVTGPGVMGEEAVKVEESIVRYRT